MNLPQALLILSQEIPIDHLPTRARLDRAYDIVRMPGYELSLDLLTNTWHIEKLSTSVLGGDSSLYTVSAGRCTCPDGQSALGGLCKHVLATRLLTLMTLPEDTLDWLPKLMGEPRE